MKKITSYTLILLSIGFGQETTAQRPSTTTAEDLMRGFNKPDTNTKSSYLYLVDITLESFGEPGPKSIRDLHIHKEISGEALFKKSKEEFDRYLPSAINYNQWAVLGEIEFATYYLLEFHMLPERGNEKRVEYYLEVLMKLPRPSDLESIAKAFRYSEEQLNPTLRYKVEKYLKSKIEEFQSYTESEGYSPEYILEHGNEAKRALVVLDSGRNRKKN